MDHFNEGSEAFASVWILEVCVIVEDLLGVKYSVKTFWGQG